MIQRGSPVGDLCCCSIGEEHSHNIAEQVARLAREDNNDPQFQNGNHNIEKIIETSAT